MIEKYFNYINYFFQEIVGLRSTKDEISNNYIEDLEYVSIIADDINRLKNGKLTGSKRDYRICLFYFNKADKKEIDSYLVNKFKCLKKNKPWLFIRNYVYIIHIDTIDDAIEDTKNYQIYYYNTNHQFNKITRKQDVFVKTSGIENNFIFIDRVHETLEYMQKTNIDMINCVRAYQGNLDFLSISDENFEQIKKAVEDDNEYIFVEGPAGSGKTILAMRLLNQYSEANLLIINSYFYFALKETFKVLGYPFPYERIYQQDPTKENCYWIMKNNHLNIDTKFTIVDEAQRLGYVWNNYGEMESSMLPFTYPNKIKGNESHQHSHTIFLGDDNQRLMPYDKGMKDICIELKSKMKKIDNIIFEDTIRIPNNIHETINYLLDYDRETPPNINIGEYEIHLTDDDDTFIDMFQNDKTMKKHYVTYYLKENNEQIGNDIVSFRHSGMQFDNNKFLFQPQIASKYILTTLEVVSREMNSVYLYIPDADIFHNCTIDKIKDKNNYFYRHLYTIMTRATSNLIILCKERNLYNHFKERLNIIKELKYPVSSFFNFEKTIRKRYESMIKLYQEYSKVTIDYEITTTNILGVSINNQIHFSIYKNTLDCIFHKMNNYRINLSKFNEKELIRAFVFFSSKGMLK